MDGTTAYVRNPSLLKDRLGIQLDSVETEIARLQCDGKTVVVVGTETGVRGFIAIHDNVRFSAPKLIEALHARGVQVAMLTGNNRRTAEAMVGIAMGAAGTDVAIDTAEVVLTADDLQKLGYALNVASKNRRVVRQNLVPSTLVIGVLVVGAVSGSFTLPIAVIATEVSEFVVSDSGLRMLRA